MEAQGSKLKAMLPINIIMFFFRLLPWKNIGSSRLKAQGIAAYKHYHLFVWTCLGEEGKLKALPPIYILTFFFRLGLIRKFKVERENQGLGLEEMNIY